MSDPSCLVWPFFDRTHRNLAEELEAFARSLAPSLEGEDVPGRADADAACRRLVGLMGEVGLFSVAVPALYGGRHERLDLRSLALVRERLAYAHAGADFVFAMQGLSAGPISLFGTNEQNDRFLPGIARGEAIAATALKGGPTGGDGGGDAAAESGGNGAGAASKRDPDAPGLVARPGRGWFTLDGHTGWIANGAIADLVILEAEVTGDNEGRTSFILEAGTAGLHIEERLSSLAPASLARLRLKGCRIPHTNLLGQVGQGGEIVRVTAETFRPCLAGAALGLARRAFDAIRRHPAALPERQGAIAAALDAATLLVYRAAWQKDVRGAGIAREAAMAELEAFRAAAMAIETAMTLLGAEALKPGGRLEALPRELQALRLQAAPAEALLRRLADPASPEETGAAPPEPPAIEPFDLPRPDQGGPEGSGTIH